MALAKRGRRKPRGVPPVETVLQLRLHGTIVLPTSKRSVALGEVLPGCDRHHTPSARHLVVFSHAHHNSETVV